MGAFSQGSLERKIIASINLLQAMKQASNLHLRGGNDSNLLTTFHNLFLSMHIYEQFQQKIAFSGPHIPLMCSWSTTAVWEDKILQDLTVEQSKRLCRTAAYLPVTWSTRIREVIMRPYCEKSCSNSFWVIVLGSPLTYKFASLIEAELGRA